MMGDLSGHTQTQNDFISLDSERCPNYVPLPVNYNADVGLSRSNHDSRPPDNRGKDILDFCKASSMKILNGRKFGDTNGRFTCYSRNALIPSVIDYAIVDSDILEEIIYFMVDSLTTYSDHCPISFRLKANFTMDNINVGDEVNVNPLPSKYIWSNMSADAFKLSLNSTEIGKCLSRICSTRYVMSTQGVNQLVNDVNGVVYDAAKIANIKCVNPPRKKKQKNI
jgi:hypothetical protein